MCGIAGVLSHDGAVAEHLDLLARLVALVARRGPDDAGEWSDGSHVALGFRRLSVLDPTPAGHQPMVSADGRHVIAFNGEVYNFAELRARLEGQGASFRSRTDTEVVLEALVAWGPSALERCNGMFALAWYDRGRRTLVLARDPMGVKPLWWLDHPRGVVFGSQYDQLLRHPFCDRSAIREDVLSLYLRLGYIPPPYGLIRGTFQVEPGTYVRVRAGVPGAEVVRYWSPPPAGADAGQEEIAAAGGGAVWRQTVSDVPTGAFLSGGVDSPLVAATMQAASPARPVPAFTIGCTDPARDESAAAAAYAEHLGVDHHLRVFDVGDCLALVDEMAQAYSEPFGDHSALPTMMVSSLARERVTVALAGDGGDELFWGYPRFAKVLAARSWFGVPRAVRALGYGAGGLLRRGRPPRGVLFGSIGAWYQDSHSGLRTADLDQLCPPAVAPPQDFDLYDLDGVPDRAALARWLRANELRGHLQMLLTKVDRASMHYGLEVRVPLLDLEVVKIAHRVDPDECIDRATGTGKLPLRASLGRHVPPASISGPKRGFDVPVGDFLRHELAPRVRGLLVERDPWPDSLFSRPAVRRYVDGHLNGTHDRTQGLWHLFALQLWADTHLRSPSLVLRRTGPN